MIEISRLLDADRIDTSLELTFPETWHASVFAITVELSRAGYFTWAEWVERFSAGEPAHQPCETELEDYFARWLVELERLVGDRLDLSQLEITETAEHWRRSYVHTEHGQPVLLERNLPDGSVHHHHHDHHHHGDSGMAIKAVPVSVSKAIGAAE